MKIKKTPKKVSSTTTYSYNNISYSENWKPYRRCHLRLYVAGNFETVGYQAQVPDETISEMLSCKLKMTHLQLAIGRGWS